LPGNAAKACADGFHGKRQHPAREGRDNDRDQNARPVWPQPAQHDDNDDADRGDRDRRTAGRVQAAHQCLQFRDEFARFLSGKRDAKEILELACEDDDGDAGGEPNRDRIGDEFDVGAKLQKTGGHQKHPGHGGRENHAVHPVTFGGQRHEHDECAGRTSDLKPAAAEQRNDEAADDGGIETAIGRHAGCDRDRHRERKRDDRYRQTGESIGAKIDKGVALAQNRDELGRI